MLRLTLHILPAVAAIAMAAGCVRGGDKMDRMVSAADWDGIVRACADAPDSLRYKDIFSLNLALAQRGELAEKAFQFPQAGSLGLVPEWDRTQEAGEWLSDIYFAMGHIALAQRMAFEAAILDDSFNARMYRRLVQTNIIYGAWPVAEKYISLLEKDRRHSRWARGQRRFLYDDSAVDADSLYSLKRACIPAEDFFSGVRGLDRDLKDIIRQNPSHRSTIAYLGLIYLTDLDFEAFHSLLDEFYGTEALPELPRSFAEAVCMMSETDYGLWKRMGVSREDYERYKDFKKRLGAGLSLERYEKTFWSYVMKENIADE